MGFQEMSMRPLLFLSAIVFLTADAPAQDKKPAWWDKAVKKVEATFDPAEARPGQTVTFKLTVELHDGYYTYPTRQEDKNAEAMVNKLVFPDAGAVVFVGETADPAEYQTRAEPLLGIKDLRYYPKKVVYERKAVVRPTQTPGAAAVKVKAFGLTVCDANNCYPARKLTPEATLKVLNGPAVPVEAKYADDVRKATAGM
jgi:hypothetical protein